MRRLFDRVGKSRDEWEEYDVNEYDWDASEDYEGYDNQEYAEEAYYTENDEAMYGKEEYYSEEYYGEDDESVYDEVPYEEEVYEEVVYDEAPYEDGADTYYADTRQSRKGRSRKNHIFLFIWENFLQMGAMDRIITVTGIIALLLVLVAGGLYVSTKLTDNKRDDFTEVGSQLDGITLIGEKGLLAVADAEKARQVAAEIVEEAEEAEEPKEYDEEGYSNAVTVKLNMVSVVKDLKIKFVGKDSGKLVPNVPFTVTVTKPDGESETWSDDDMDGIIYKKDIEAGTYKVLVNELTGDKYKGYVIPSGIQSVEVKREITYEKIDVSDEVKTESEIDVSKEDVKANETAVESTLQDTVQWVESTAVAETYTEVSKSTIPDPATLAGGENYTPTDESKATVSGGDIEINVKAYADGNIGTDVEDNAETDEEENGDSNVAFTVTVNPTTAKMRVGGTTKVKVTAADYSAGKKLKYSVKSDDTDVATAKIDNSGNITIKAVAAGKATVTAKVQYAEGEKFPVTATLTVTVLDNPVLTLNKPSVTAFVEKSVVVKAAVANALTKGTVTAESSRPDVATVSVEGKQVTITGVSAGEAVITVKFTEKTGEAQATCLVRVEQNPRENTVDKLKDSKGNQLYVEDNGAYREAVYADYYTADKLFLRGETKFTGWQNFDGKIYYFTADGKKLVGDHVIQGAKYKFDDDGSLDKSSGILGIDVSKWQGDIDWNAVKRSGISYVIIRCGYRGYTQGSLVEDPKYDANIKGATAAGLKVGVYFFTQALNETEAIEEASFVLDQIKNYKISYPVFLDVEASGGRADRIDKATRTEVCKAFCKTIQNSGYKAGIYANKTWLTQYISAEALNGYKIWLAQYAAEPTYTGRYDMWQYSSSGKVSGIQGNVDMDLSYLGY